jgi:hypothetical protein
LTRTATTSFMYSPAPLAWQVLHASLSRWAGDPRHRRQFRQGADPVALTPTARTTAKGRAELMDRTAMPRSRASLVSCLSSAPGHNPGNLLNVSRHSWLSSPCA